MNYLDKIDEVLKSKEFFYTYSKEFNQLRSAVAWSDGYRSYDYEGNDNGYIQPEQKPESFKEFDKLVELVFPNIEYIQYKNLYNKSCSINSRRALCYYSSPHQEHQYVCDIKKFKQWFRDLEQKEKG